MHFSSSRLIVVYRACFGQDSQAKRLKETQAPVISSDVGGLQSRSVLFKLRNPLANGQSQPIERGISLLTT